MEEKYSFNLRLKKARKRANLSQQEVANKIGITRLTVTRWENGISYPYPYHREKLCKLFQEDMKELFPTNRSFYEERVSSVEPLPEKLSTSFQTILHALNTGKNDEAADLIIGTAEQMINQGGTDFLARWIDAFPESNTEFYLKLLLIRVNIYLGQGNYPGSLSLLNTAEVKAEAIAQTQEMRSLSLEEQNEKLSILHTELSLARSRFLFKEREYRQSQLVCQQALANLINNKPTLRGEAYIQLGQCHISLGDFVTGIAQVQKALQIWGRHSICRQTADGHSILAATYSLLGNFALAEHHMSRAFACWEQLQDNYGKIDNLVRAGDIRVRQGYLVEAESLFQQALVLAREPVYYRRGEAYALDHLGVLYQRLGQYDRALAATEEALALARQIHEPSLVSDALCDLALIYLAMGDAVTAMLLISEVETQTILGNPIGYKQALRDLIYGIVYFHQEQYQQAQCYLSASETVLSKVGLKQEYLQVLLHLAAFHLAQDQLPNAVCCLDAVTPIIAICEGYEQLAKLEVRRLPALENALKTLPELARLKVLFHLASESQIILADEKLEDLQERQVAAQSVSLALSSSETAALVTPASYLLTIQALGEPIVCLRQEPIVHWRMSRALELCFFLLDCDRPMRKEAIITALWPEIDEQTTSVFNSTVYYLRKALGGESAIVAGGGMYTLRLDTLYGNSVWYDVKAFLNARMQAKQALESEQDAQAKEAFQRMVELYRGDYVQPFYNDWSILRRDELRTAYLDARQQLALIAWRAEEWDESVVHWQHMLAIDNWLEEAHYGLMRCYARQGKRELALRQYHLCKDTLEQEFGVAPKASIQNLYRRLMGS